MTTPINALPPIQDGDIVVVLKGCNALRITKGTRARVASIIHLGPDYSHHVKVTLTFHGRTVALVARHINRLCDPAIRLNDGNPFHVVIIGRK